MQTENITITIVDDPYAVMPEGDESERTESLARYSDIADRELAAAFPSATIDRTWGDTFSVSVPEINPEDADVIEEQVRAILERVFENGGW